MATKFRHWAIDNLAWTQADMEASQYSLPMTETVTDVPAHLPPHEAIRDVLEGEYGFRPVSFTTRRVYRASAYVTARLQRMFDNPYDPRNHRLGHIAGRDRSAR